MIRRHACCVLTSTHISELQVCVVPATSGPINSPPHKEEAFKMMRKTAVVVALLAHFVTGRQITTPSCVVAGSDVVISFENDNAKEGDWIGLIPESAVDGHVPDPHDNNWIWTCGSQNCTSSPELGSVTISAPNLSGASTWVAVLARFHEDSKPNEMITTSAAFHVSTTGSCGGVVSSRYDQVHAIY